MGTAAGFVPASVPECPYAPRMTRAAALALRAAAGLRENCVVVITDGPVIGTAGNTSPTEIELQPQSPTDLGMAALVHTTFDGAAWTGRYDIDLGAGTITELTDGFGNTVKDLDANAPTVQGQFPWHLGSATFRDNYIEDSVLTGWDTQVGAITNNRITESTLDFTGRTGGTVSQSEFISHTATITGSFSAIRTNLTAGTITKAGGATLSFTNTQLDVVTVNIVSGAAGTVVINDSDLRSSAVTLPATNVGNLQMLSGNAGQFTLNHAGAGNVQITACWGRIDFTSSAASDHTTGINRVGGVGLLSIVQNSTGGHATTGDQIVGSVIEGDAQIVLNNTTDVGRNYSKMQLDSGGLVTVADAGNAPQCIGQVKVDTVSTLNVQAGGSVITSRFSCGAIFNTGAFLAERVIIEGNFTKTATAGNFNKLCNKSFDDVV